jgi:hypothetical protein
MDMTSEMIDIADRLSINELLSRYCHSIDAARADLCAGLFTEDATLQTAVGNAKGGEAIRAWVEGRLALRKESMQVRHYLLNVLLAPVSADLVRARSTLLYATQARDAETSAQLLATGIYEDEVRRTAEGWRFSRRTVEMAPELDDAYFM